MRQNFIKTIIIFILIQILNSPVRAGEKIAVIKGQYDKIDRVLENYKIPFDLIEKKSIEDEGIYKKYSSIFFPSGIDKPVHANIKLLSMGRKIKSVSLKKDYHKVDKEKVGKYIRDFVEKGGSAYFSGYTYKYLQKAFEPFSFFNNFPYMGLPGRIVSFLKNDLKRFCVKESAALYTTYPGWIALESAEDAEILAEATYNTPKGERSGPISLLFHKGNGEILFTSYYNSVFNDFRRFNIYRIAGGSLLKKIIRRADKYEQVISGKIVDSMHKKENFRIYEFDLKKGNNTFYFISDKDYYQVDIYDRNMSLVYSVDSFKKKLEIDIESMDDDNYFVKIYPSTKNRFGMYALITAEGDRVLPYFKKIVVFILVTIMLILTIFVLKFFGGKKYPGRKMRFT